jgi:hypothetical protein
MGKITYVTALLDIKRGELTSQSFNRPFQRYLDTLSMLLRHMGDKNMVVYIEEKYFDFVYSVKPKNIILRGITTDDIKKTEYYDKIQLIRNKPEWRNQVGWLSESTQANLELYNPLIFQKMHLLDEVSSQNPFNDDYFVWIDSGIANAQSNPGYFSKPWFEERLTKYLNKFLFLCFPYQGHNEIHGFERKAIHKFSQVDYVDRVARATFFGGKREEIEFLTKKYRELSHKTLDEGYMGTEESLFTILTYLYENIINVEMIPNHGLVFGFFEKLQNNVIDIPKNFDGRGSFIYLGTKIQQNPNTLKVFNDFFEKNKDIELVIEIGTAWGGLSMHLQDNCNKISAKFITYDIAVGRKEMLNNNPEFSKRNIDMRVCDIFLEESIKEIKDLIINSNRTLILCDGGDKIREFNIISDFLKSGDIIMAHDYAPNVDIFEKEYKDKIWNWHEIKDQDIEHSVSSNGLKKYYPDFEKVAWVCKIKSYQKKTDLYVVTFNAPDQFEFLCKSIIKASPEMFNNSDKYVLNNSIDKSTTEEYEKLFKQYNFTEFRREDNLGICGGRQFIAEHFDTTQNEYMFFFEDDMSMNGPEDKGKVCKNGFSLYHENLYKNMLKIMDREGYDFMKWCFTEFYGDNRTQWAWYNVPQDFREIHWPNKTKLPERGLDPDAPLTNFKNIKSMNGLPYADGEIYYCNWPQIVSKIGNKKMFLETKWKHPYEQTWMSYMFKQTIAGHINPAILLLTPITHDRFHHYDGSLRKES